MLNPLRSERDAFRALVWVLAAAWIGRLATDSMTTRPPFTVLIEASTPMCFAHRPSPSRGG